MPQSVIKLPDQVDDQALLYPQRSESDRNHIRHWQKCSFSRLYSAMLAGDANRNMYLFSAITF